MSFTVSLILLIRTIIRSWENKEVRFEIQVLYD